jgi:CheY-like chemotaxis protein
MMQDTAEVVRRELPYLRRYARALTGDQAAGDRMVHDALAALTRVAAPPQLDRLELFRALHRAVREDPGGGRKRDPDAVIALRLDRLAPERRQALLLSALERLDAEQIAFILDLPSAADALALIDAARGDMRAQEATRVLIIEDEPVIALDIASHIEQVGHTVVGIAATAEEAVTLAEREQPGLVLADIQLGDGSSGIDAANEILSSLRVPIVFVTAFPERLLTGQRPEPTFVVTKPFAVDTLSVAISQALITRQRLGRRAA